jgi:hypothetical protein
LDNFIDKWIESDKKLYDLIMEIEVSGVSNQEMAEMAFHALPPLYDIPKMPSDILVEAEVHIPVKLNHRFRSKLSHLFRSKVNHL